MEHFMFYFGYYFIASMSFCTGLLVGAAWRNHCHDSRHDQDYL